MDGGSQVEIHERFAFVRKEPAHHKDARVVDATGAELHAFIDGADREPSGALRNERARDFERAVSIGIRLDDAGDRDVGPDNVAHGAVVAGDLITGDEDVGAEGRH